MLFEQTTESRFALSFVQIKKAKIENMLGIQHLDILVASWFVYNFIVKNKEKIQSTFKNEIDLCISDKLLTDIIIVLHKAQKRGFELQDELPFSAEKMHLVI